MNSQKKENIYKNIKNLWQTDESESQRVKNLAKSIADQIKNDEALSKKSAQVLENWLNPEKNKKPKL